MKVLRADYGSPEGPQCFVKSLKETGFAVIAKHPISKDLIDEVYSEWKNFFNSEEKHQYKFDKDTQAGYFPFGSEHAKDSKTIDLKEFFHIYDGKVYPKEISDKSFQLKRQLLQLGQTLLKWIDELSPAEIRKNYSMPLHHMVENSDKNLFRIIHYPPLAGTEPEGAIRAAAHEDINLITLLPASTAMGLQVLDLNGNWHEVPGDYGEIVVNVGDMLQMASRQYYRSTTHRVINPPGDLAKSSRYSMPLFLHPRSEVPLSETHTAGSYLEERLREIGLK